MKFKVGDKVRVLPSLEKDVIKRNWYEEMLTCIGKEGIISVILGSEDNEIRIIFEGEEKEYKYYFCPTHLEKISSILNSVLEEEQIILNQNN